MYGPYKVISRTDEHITYEYNTWYQWADYLVFLVFMVGLTLNDWQFTPILLIVIFAFFVLKIIPGRETQKRIRNAMKNSSVRMSGDSNSFSNPLTVRIPTDA